MRDTGGGGAIVGAPGAGGEDVQARQTDPAATDLDDITRGDPPGNRAGRHGEPEGGAWNFDAENREAFGRDAGRP